jgi:Flp pilus assembly pilin Flp
MSGHKVNQVHPPRRRLLWIRRAADSRTRGQALLEYALILVLVAIALIAVFTITGPAVGNVFSNTVFNLLGGTVEPRNTLSADQFWTQVAAAASYTPESPGLITNTPAPKTSTPTPGPTWTPTEITPSPMPSDTPTAGPSPTPIDRGFGYPFEDPGGNPDWWQHDFDDLIPGPWNAEFWNYSDFGLRSDMLAMVPGTGKWRTTYDHLDFDWSGSPNAAVASDFYARFTTTVQLENKTYTWKIRKDDGIRIWVNGALVVDANVPKAGDPATWSYSPLLDNWFYRSFTAAAGSNDIKVEFFDNSNYARIHVFLTEEQMLDIGDCGWALSSEAYHSPTLAWADSPGKLTSGNSYCTLALRGTIDLTGATNPKLEFYDRYNLASNTYALVGVSVAGSGTWADAQIHTNETNLGWTRQVYDLTNFADPDGTGPATGTNFKGKLIELRFVLDARNSSSPGDGWWLDDISVMEDMKRRYTVGFSDDMEGTSHWYPGGSWARSNEAVHSGIAAWSDSPGTSYMDGSNSVLELDGVIDLADPAVVDPQIAFWQRYDLGYGDRIYAEVSTDNRATWTALTGGSLAYQSSELAWSQKVLSLKNYKGQQIYFRFRLDARSDSRVGDGWWIDDFAIRNNPQVVIYPDWCDGMEAGGDQWIPEGTWSVLNFPDTNPNQPAGQAIYAHSGSSYWSDSPGTDYAHNTNSALQLSAKLDLTASSKPQMVFWQQYDLAYSDDLYVEVSEDGGTTWTGVWHYYYNSLPVGYGCSGCTIVSDPNYNHNLAWTREVINLTSYVGKQIDVRFRLDSTYDPAVDDGWWLDDVCFQENPDPIRTLPFNDGFEAGGGNWYAGGTWTASTENKYDGNFAFSDSPGQWYKHETNSILELRTPIDLTGTVKPALFYWEAFNLEYRDYALVEVNVSDDKGETWGGWREITAARHRYTTTMSWDRRQVDLLPFRPDASHPDRVIRIRFRLLSENDPAVADGWWLDDVSILDRDGQEPYFTVPFNENAEYDNTYWVFDGTWTRMPMYRVIGSGAALGPGGWLGEYYDDLTYPSGDSRRANRQFDNGELVFTQTDTDIDFNWGSSSRPAGLPYHSESPNNYFLVRWTRSISIADDNTEYTIQASSDDGVRVWVDKGTPGQRLVIDKWIDRGFPSSPDLGKTGPLSAGMHTFTIEYYEATGDARVLVDFGQQGYVFHDSYNPDYDDYTVVPNRTTPYLHLSDMSLTLKGVIDLAGTVNPALTYWNMRALGYGDRVYTEISTDEGYTWTTLLSSSGTDLTWKKRYYDLSAYAGQKITIRFRLDARSNPSVGDGWFIDDIQVAE